MSKHDPTIPTRGEAIRLLGIEQEKVRTHELYIQELQTERKRLERVNAELAQANVHLHSQLEKEKKEMPRNGRNVWAFLSAAALSIAGYFMPAAPLACCGASFSGNLYQLTAAVLLLILFVGPFVLRVLGILKATKAE